MFKMTSAEVEEMYNRKGEYLKRLQLVFKADPRSGVKSIEFHRHFEGYPEVAEIQFESGFSRYINITGNSDWANYKNVGAAVYGGDVVGEFFIQENKKRT